MKRNTPINIRVVGFGKNSIQTINAVSALGYDGLGAEVYSDNNELSPTEEDIMIILLGTTNSERVRSIAKTFYDANVLTLAIMTRNEKIPTDCLDSYTVVEPDKVVEAIKSLVAPIFMPCQIAYDFNDLRQTLANSSQFFISSADGHGDNRIKNALNEVSLSIDLQKREDLVRLSIILYYNRNGNDPLTMSEMSELSEFINALPDKVEAIWGLYIDDSLNPDSIRISIIAAGK